MTDPRLSPTDAPDRSGFFEHHGVWAPGVRLFRQLSFRSKALMISLAFLLPLAAVASAYVRQSNAERSLVEREAAGAAFGRELLALLARVQEQRALASGADADAARAAVAARATSEQLQRVTALHEPLRQDVPREALDVLLANAEKAANAPANPLAANKRHSQVGEAVLALLQRTLDGTGLGIDPQPDTRHLIQVGLGDLPRAVEAALAQADMAIAATAGAPSSLVAMQMATPRAIGTYLDGKVRDSIDLVAAHEPGLASLIAYAPTQEAMAAVVDAASAAVESGQDADAGAVRAARDALVREAAALQGAVLGELETRLDGRAAAAAAEQRSLGALLAVSLVVAAYLFFAFARVMQGGLREVEHHLRAMSAGDLTTTPRPWGRDEAARVLIVLGEMQQWLRGIVAQVRDSSRDVDSASESIAIGSSQLAESTRQGASTLAEATATMERIGAKVRATAERAGAARQSGQANLAAARNGGAVIGQVIETMRGINVSSRKIGEITAAIDGIAFQTNVLALNAAVEAARAGDAGRGFAVVASEVRALALRSATAAREIKELVAGTLAEVEAGTVVVQRAGSAIGEMVVASEQVDRHLSDFAADAIEQADGVLEVSRSVAKINEVTSESVALVEEAEASAARLRDEAGQLTARVDRFRLPEPSAAGPERAQRPHAGPAARQPDLSLDYVEAAAA